MTLYPIHFGWFSCMCGPFIFAAAIAHAALWAPVSSAVGVIVS